MHVEGGGVSLSDQEGELQARPDEIRVDLAVSRGLTFFQACIVMAFCEI